MSRGLRRLAIASVLAFAAATTTGTMSGRGQIVLPNGWLIRQPTGTMTQTDTMPQGAAASPDDKTLAVVNAGYNQPTLRLYSVPALDQIASIPLPGAFGRPLWLDGSHVLIAGANADALLDVDVSRQEVRSIPMPAHSYPVAVAKFGDTFAVATDGDTVRARRVARRRPCRQGHPYWRPHRRSRIRSERDALRIELLKQLHRRNRYANSSLAPATTGLHPTAILALKDAVYVAETDADTVGVYDPSTQRRVASIYVGDLPAAMMLDGVSPNALAQHGDAVFVSLGAANAIAVVRGHAVVERLAAGWYPTDVVPVGERLYIIDGKGEGSPPNPYFQPQRKSDFDYIATLEYGSIRTSDLHAAGRLPNPQGALGWREHTSDPWCVPAARSNTCSSS